MKILGYSWAGVPTGDFKRTMDFFENALKLPLVRREAEDDFRMFILSSGHKFEVFGPRSHENKFMSMPPIAFDVEDVYKARAELEPRDIRFITEIATSQSGDAAWIYFVRPDKFLYEIWQHK